MRKLLIDTDAGIDDSIALLYANSLPDVDIVAITTVYGTATLENTTRNVLDLCSLIGLDTRVAAGRDRPIVAKPRPVGDFHGESGVGLAKFPPATMRPDPAYAWDVMYEEARAAGKLTVVTLGPLTNLAVALLKYEDLPRYVDKIVMMGGGTGAGNAGIFGEANIHHDPHACEIVLRCGAPLVMAGLNATECTRMSTAEWNRVFSRRTRLWRVLRDMFAVYKQSQNKSGEMGLVIHDAAAMLAALRPETANTAAMHVQCETVEGPMYGRTIADFRPYADGPKNVDVITEIDKRAFLMAMDEMMEFYAKLD